VKKQLDLMKQFCYIQLQVLKDREVRLRKEIQECQIQKEFVNAMIEDLANSVAPLSNGEN
tara:strand:+ start:638 stop:817 length:180 start_codon:yes stop_codon:yes gene_type:complete